ncbi:hypothetical protein I4U23_009813 [Adineta vaga]|nr:hypothetical protein I4U23_009813 [Adineta vaga]
MNCLRCNDKHNISGITTKKVDVFMSYEGRFPPLNVSDAIIPLPKVQAALLGPIVDYCNYHKNDSKSDIVNDDDDDDDPNKDIYEPKRSDDISEWDLNFIKNFTVADGTLFDIIMAANFLGIKSLIAVGCKTIANMVRGKASTEVREMFNISHDPPGEGLNAPNAIEGSSNQTSVN